MTITFKSENNVKVYALEKIISYARKHQYIFVAQSVWWIASVIGLEDGLATHIQNLRIWSEAYWAPLESHSLSLEKEEASVLHEHIDIDTKWSCVHPDRIPQIDNTVNDSYEVESSESESEQATIIIKNAKEFLCKSRKERQVVKRKPCVLSRTRMGKIPVKPLTKSKGIDCKQFPRIPLSHIWKQGNGMNELGGWCVDVILPIVCEHQIYQGRFWKEMNLRDQITSYIHCQFCITPQYDLVAIHLIASDTTIYMCPCCVYDLYRIPSRFFWDYASGISIGSTAVYLVSSYKYLWI